MSDLPKKKHNLSKTNGAREFYRLCEKGRGGHLLGKNGTVTRRVIAIRNVDVARAYGVEFQNGRLGSHTDRPVSPLKWDRSRWEPVAFFLIWAPTLK